MITTENTSQNKISDPVISAMFSSGAHYGYSRSRRHPSMKPFIFGAKNKTEIFDLDKTKESIDKALEVVRTLASQKKQILFVSSKHEALNAIKSVHDRLGMPYVAGRWIGGTLTNFGEIRKRVEKQQNLLEQKTKGELSKYTKKERLLIDREIDNLTRFFSGLVVMKDIPAALFVIDPKREKTAISEAKKMNVPVISLSGSDCNINDSDFPIPGNDSSMASISFFIDQIVKAYEEGRKKSL
ncbi:MAG: 30S ribosomal protein S2 [Candidatus Paceibacterota bacterium]